MSNVKKGNAPHKWLNVAIALCAAALVAVLSYTVSMNTQAEAAKNEYTTLQSMFDGVLDEYDDELGLTNAKEVAKSNLSAKSAAEKRAKDETSGQAAYEALSKNADAKSPEDRFEVLRAQFSDVVGWIKGQGTMVNYPVMQGSNNSYYLNHLYNGKRNHTGAIFMDASNRATFDDQNTILYGHHMRNGSMFASLVNYRKQYFYKEHPTMTLYTPKGAYLVEFFAGYSASSSDSDAFQLNFVSDESFAGFVASARKKSTFKSNVEVSGSDKVLTLCTCTYEIYNGRYVLHGKLTRL